MSTPFCTDTLTAAAPPRFPDVGAVFDCMGGARAVGSAACVSAKTAAGWRSRNSIPVEYWPSLIASAKGQAIGLCPGDLMWACEPDASSSAFAERTIAETLAAAPRDCEPENPGDAP